VIEERFEDKPKRVKIRSRK